MKNLTMVLVLGLVLVGCKKEEAAEVAAPSVAAPVSSTPVVTPTNCIPSVSSQPSLGLANYSVNAIDYIGYNNGLSGTLGDMSVMSNAHKSGCSITKYEINVVAGFYSVISGAKPAVLSAWQTVSQTNGFNYGFVVSTSASQLSVCLRAITSIGEESTWYCSAKSFTASPLNSLNVNVNGAVLQANFSAKTSASYIATQIRNASGTVVYSQDIAGGALSDNAPIGTLPSGNYTYSIQAVDSGMAVSGPVFSASFSK